MVNSFWVLENTEFIYHNSDVAILGAIIKINIKMTTFSNIAYFKWY